MLIMLSFSQSVSVCFFFLSLSLHQKRVIISPIPFIGFSSVVACFEAANDENHGRDKKKPRKSRFFLQVSPSTGNAKRGQQKKWGQQITRHSRKNVKNQNLFNGKRVVQKLEKYLESSFTLESQIISTMYRVNNEILINRKNTPDFPQN